MIGLQYIVYSAAVQLGDLVLVLAQMLGQYVVDISPYADLLARERQQVYQLDDGAVYLLTDVNGLPRLELPAFEIYLVVASLAAAGLALRGAVGRYGGLVRHRLLSVPAECRRTLSGLLQHGICGIGQQVGILEGLDDERFVQRPGFHALSHCRGG